MNVKTFANSDEAIAYLQSLYGTEMWSQYEYIRQPFYSYQTYPEAGGAVFNFFGQTVGGSVTLADTNMPSAGNFQSGWNFLVLGIGMDMFLKTDDQTVWTGTDATTIVSDLLLGFAQAGVLTWNINSFQYLQLPTPFLLAPPGYGQADETNRGNYSTTVTSQPMATLNNRRYGWKAPRPVLIESGQTFQFQLAFPSGLVPVIGTSITDDTSNPLKIKVELDGILFRPVTG